MDHCVECLCSLSGNPYSDGLAVAALSLLVRGLRGVQQNPSDMEARSQCQLGIFQALPGREENTQDDVFMWWVQPNDKNWSHEIGANVCEQHGKVSNVLFERARSLEAKVLNAFQAYTLCRYIKIRSYTYNQFGMDMNGCF